MTEEEQKGERQRLRCRYCTKLNTIWLQEKETSSDHHCKRCKLPLSEAEHLKWEAVDANSYIHPLDRQALSALKQIPGIDLALKKLISVTFERYFRVAFKANSVRVSKDQYASLDAKLDVVCKTLSLPKPQLYVSVTSNVGGLGINAFTTGADDPFIVLYAGLVERLDDDELLAVIAHEMGHIHCEHLLYRTAAVALWLLLNTFLGRTPVGAILKTISLPIQIALLMWSQKSELSCDRTAQLVVQDRDVVMRALIKLAGGVLSDELSLEAYIRQADEFQKSYDEDFLDKFYTLLLASQSTHPFPVWRISEILKWTDDKSPAGYDALVAQGTRISVPSASQG